METTTQRRTDAAPATTSPFSLRALLGPALDVRDSDLEWFSQHAYASLVWDTTGAGPAWPGAEAHVRGPVPPRWAVGALWARGVSSIDDTLDAFERLERWHAACRPGAALFLTLPGRRDDTPPFGASPADPASPSRRRWRCEELLSVASSMGWQVLGADLRHHSDGTEVVLRALAAPR